MKIVRVETLISCGPYAKSKHWKQTRAAIHKAVCQCCWPPGSSSFTIYPESGKKRGEGNGVVPIKDEFIRQLKAKGWVIEGRSKNALGQELGTSTRFCRPQKAQSLLNGKPGTSPRATAQ